MASWRVRVGLILAALLLGAAIWVTADLQRATATTAAARTQEPKRLLTAMLDQETGLRGYLLTADREFLQPYTKGRRDYARADRALRREAEGNTAVRAQLARAEVRARLWQRFAAATVAATPPGVARPVDVRAALARKRLMDAFRVQAARLQAVLARQREHDQSRAAVLSMAISVVVFLLVGGVGVFFVTRRQRAEAEREARERRFLATQAELAEALQRARSEREAVDVLVRHIEETEEGRTASVLLGASGCGAIHRRRPVTEGCGLCPSVGEKICRPLIVSGETIGAVLVRQDRPFDELDERRVRESVAYAAPVLGNLRAIARAESQAATDALTGLPNRRAFDDALGRLVAYSRRQATPLAAVVLDLDHFKQINDEHGHAAGDATLAAVARALAVSVRASDVVARLGGEEFVVLAPDTDRRGGAVLAEHVRAEIARTAVPGLPGGVTASLGVAALPDDAQDGGELLREADRALYAAKANGRDRVECAGSLVATPA